MSYNQRIQGYKDNIYYSLNFDFKSQRDQFFSVESHENVHVLKHSEKKGWGKIWQKIVSFFGFGSLKRVIKFIAHNESIFKELKQEHQDNRQFLETLSLLREKVLKYGKNHKCSINQKIVTVAYEALSPLEALPLSGSDVLSRPNFDGDKAKIKKLDDQIENTHRLIQKVAKKVEDEEIIESLKKIENKKNSILLKLIKIPRDTKENIKSVIVEQNALLNFLENSLDQVNEKFEKYRDYLKDIVIDFNLIAQKLRNWGVRSPELTEWLVFNNEINCPNLIVRRVNLQKKLDEQTVVFNTLEKMIVNYGFDYLNKNLRRDYEVLCHINAMANTILLAHRALNADPKYNNETEALEVVETASQVDLIVSKNTKERRLSVVALNDPIYLGAGSFGIIESFLSLTTGDEVAIKRAKGELGKQEIISETRVLERFKVFAQNHVQTFREKLKTRMNWNEQRIKNIVIPPFLPIQEITHKFEYLRTGDPGFMSLRYDLDLWNWNKQTHPFDMRFDAFYQILYMASFNEQIEFTNFDTKEENIFVKNIKRHDAKGNVVIWPRIAFADTSGGTFGHENNRVNAPLLYTEFNTPYNEVQKIEESTDARNNVCRRKLAVFQAAYAMFIVLSGINPHDVEGKGTKKGHVKWPFLGKIKKESRKTLKAALLNQCNPKTADSICEILEKCLQKDPNKRPDCLEVLEKMNTLIKADPILKGKFDRIPWMQDVK